MVNLPLSLSTRTSDRKPSASNHPLQPYSPQKLRKASHIEGATLTESICPYCAVGCGLHIYTKA